MQTESGGHLFVRSRRKKIVMHRYVPILKETPSEAQNLPASLKKQGGLFQLSRAWKVCLQEHPHSCNNKHLQLQELC